MPFGVDDLAIAGLALGGVSSIANFGLGLANYNYQKELQRSIFNREDTSIARRVAGLKASGLSPVLAAGQGAGTGPIVSTHPPEIDPTLATSIFTSLATMEKDFAVKDQQIKNMSQTIDVMKENINMMRSNQEVNQYKKNQLLAQTIKTTKETQGQIIRNATDALTYKLYKSSGTGKNFGIIGTGVRDLNGILEKNIENLLNNLYRR